ncbi:MAG: lysophospholipid acyltransferase family protein [Gemmatimonadetes bacterium]|nr:lysophospholipid acyltransferase family protein [Gemmatimonadota bacterium]MYD25751.1 lysophospholipid acyltransferase family protein [Gemmatimonadota bacterium]MYI98522.1 lysophospholipid acyltransferase family protein [Gemmatimonadota bacterium]
MASLIKRMRNAVIYQAACAIIGLMNALPRQQALSVGGWIGGLAYLAARGPRRLALSNLTLAYGETQSLGQIRRLGRNVFRELGRNVVDVARLPRVTAENVDGLVRADGLSILESAYGEGKGVVAVSAHLGNFELMGAFLALKGFAVTVVAAPLYDARLDALLRENRVRSGLEVVPRDRATSAILRALRKGHVVGLLVDQDTRGAGIAVTFFGHPARTPTGPAVLADRTGAPIVPMAIHRLPDDTHLVTVRPPIRPTGRTPEDVETTTRAYTGELERFIRKAPAQWVWMHDRWKVSKEA